MKNRQLISAEYAIKECFQHVKMPVLEQAIGKSDGFIYKCGDPDETHQLSVRDALLIDAAVYKETGKASPFHDLFSRNIAVTKNAAQAAGSLQDSTLSMQSELGDLAGRVRAAMDRAGPGGADITPNEMAAIVRELEDIQRNITEFYILLGAGQGDAK